MDRVRNEEVRIPRMATQAVRWPGIPVDGCSSVLRFVAQGSSGGLDLELRGYGP